MIKQMTPIQKYIAYSSLAFVFVWTGWFVYVFLAQLAECFLLE